MGNSWATPGRIYWSTLGLVLVKGGEAGAAALKGSMTYAFTYGEFSSPPSVHPSGLKASF